jgi:hypothetical protein
MVHPSARQAGVLAYWRDILPADLEAAPVVMRQRAVYELALRDGGTLADYRQAVHGNRRERKAADAALHEIEGIAQWLSEASDR